MGYSKGCHTTFHHRYHIVWAPKYRFKVLHGEVRLRVREIIKQVCDELGVTISDNGTGFPHTRAGPHPRTISERVAQLAGQLRIASTTAGATLKFHLPRGTEQ